MKQIVHPDYFTNTSFVLSMTKLPVISIKPLVKSV